MSTGVVVNGYEIRNWHTVSILELARARREQGREAVPVVIESKKSKKKLNRRSKDMSREPLISEEKARELNQRYLAGESLADIVGEYDVSSATAVNYFKRFGLTYPRPRAEAPADCNTTVLHPGHEVAIQVMRENGFDEGEIARAVAVDRQLKLTETPDLSTLVVNPPDPAMDDPTPDAAALKPATEIALQEVWKQVQERTRELRERVIADTKVIAVQELPSPVLARKQYSIPRIVEAGSLMDVMNPHAAAKLVEGLVAKLNEVPGVQAYFEWRAEGRTGQPLGR